MPKLPAWYRLDNAAKIVPATAHGSDTRVFRIVCELTEPVDPVTLQHALDKTVREYNHFNVVLRKGFFWYYLDGTSLRPKVEKDHESACSMLYYPGRRNLLYRVCYFERRIILEMFHALADGTGAFTFLQTLVTGYLAEKHSLKEELAPTERSSSQEKTSDAFRHFYSKTAKSSQLGQMTGTRAYQIHEIRDANLRTHCLEGTVSAGAFLDLARRYNTTTGVLSTALIIESILPCMSAREKKYPVVISVPVNLRQYFPSETTRNFFGVINVSYNAAGYDGTLESILPAVRRCFDEQLSRDRILATMNSYSGLENNPAIRFVPLFIKDLAVQGFSAAARRGTTATVSNLGRIRMPEALDPYIDKFSAFMATPNMQICICSYGDKMVFGASSAFSGHSVMLNFFRRLTALGISTELATNDYDLRGSAQEER